MYLTYPFKWVVFLSLCIYLKKWFSSVLTQQSSVEDERSDRDETDESEEEEEMKNGEIKKNGPAQNGHTAYNNNHSKTEWRPERTGWRNAQKHKDSPEAEQRGVKNRGTVPVLQTDNRFVHYRVQTNTHTYSNSHHTNTGTHRSQVPNRVTLPLLTYAYRSRSLKINSIYWCCSKPQWLSWSYL